MDKDSVPNLMSDSSCQRKEKGDDCGKVRSYSGLNNALSVQIELKSHVFPHVALMFKVLLNCEQRRRLSVSELTVIE